MKSTPTPIALLRLGIEDSIDDEDEVSVAAAVVVGSARAVWVLPAHTTTNAANTDAARADSRCVE
ncbi:MAG: hypothetical protein WA988_08235, partial [Candidatus Nanopelagicales bacterium]